MREENTIKQEGPDQLSDILLVFDKEKMTIQAVKGVDKDGKLETVDPTKENEKDFMKVDRNGDFFTNFFSNFWRQIKDPTKFSFFKVASEEAIEKAKTFQQNLKNPTPEGEKEMKNHEVKPEPKKDQKQEEKQDQDQKQNNKQENKNDMATAQTTPETSEYRYQPEQINWDTMNNLGLGKERLEKLNLLDPLLRGFKTNELVPVSLNLNGAIMRTDARLSLQEAPNGEVVLALHGIRKEPNLNFEFFGHKFTDEDKQNLTQTGNMGRVVDLTNLKTGEKIPSFISIDRLTNEIVAARQDRIKIPDEIKGVKLNEEQKQILWEGKPLHLEGMTSKKGTQFDATVQVNADKRYVEFLFDRTPKIHVEITDINNPLQNQVKEAPKVFRGKELTDEQNKNFKDGQTVYIDGLVDKKGQTYQGYITFDKESGKTNFQFPSQVKMQAQPMEAHKTQTAVNSQGKTNEATKNIKEPLERGQQTPKNKKQQDKQNTPKSPAKSRSRAV